MASGKTPIDDKDNKPPAAPEKKPESEGDPLAELIDNFGEEVEPVAPEDDAGKGPEEA
jgi:hypothetical protein